MKTVRRALAALLCIIPSASALAVQQASIRGGVYFEAEDFDTRHPEEDGFATMTGETAASDGAVLFRFHHGYVTYDFQAPRDARYTVWLRYGAPGNATMSVAMDPPDAPEFTAVAMPATGGCVGFGVWRWAPVWQGELKAGKHTLALGSAALRPDCIFITDNGNQRPDDKMLTEVTWPPGPRLPELTHDRQITQHPKWLNQHVRICYAHVEWNKSVTIDEWCKLAAERGANVISAAGEIPAGMLDGKLKTLPVTATELPPGYKVDYSWVKEYTDAAHRHGLKYLCYVNADRTLDPLLLEHPEWRQVGLGGPQATWGCWNSPYRKAFIERMVEIARDARFDGIWIDMPFTAPRMGCRSPYCVKAFEDRFGVAPPRKARLKDPLYQRWTDFQAWTREEWLLDLTDALHAVDPEMAVLVNQTRGWIFNIADRSFLTTRAARCVDALGEEIGWETQHKWNRPWGWPLQGPWQNLFLRCRTWPGYGMMWHLTYNMPEVDLRAHAFSMLANGVAPSVTTGGNWDAMGRIWQHIKGCEPWALDAELVPWVALHFSEDTLAWYGNANGQEATSAYIENVFGLFQAALEAHLPIAIITDDDLASPEKLRQFPVVILPNTACLSDRQIASITQYVKNGGGLLATFQTGCFDEFGAARKTPGLQELLGARQGKADDGVSWGVRLAELDHPILQHPAVAASRGWGQGLVEPRQGGALYVGPADRKVGAVQTAELQEGVQSLLPMWGSWRLRKGALVPEKGSAYRALLVRSYGKGKVVYSPLDLGHAYFCYNHPLGRTLIAESLKWAASQPPPLQVEAPMIVQTVLYRKGNATIVHLVNDISSFGRSAAPNPEAFGGFRAEVIPIRDIRLGLPGKFTSIHLEPGKVSLPGDFRDGVTWIAVPQLDQHAMVVAEK